MCMYHRYTTWLSFGLSARKASDGNLNSPADAEWALSISIDDFIYVSHIWSYAITFLALMMSSYLLALKFQG